MGPRPEYIFHSTILNKTSTMNLDSASTLQHSFDSYNSPIDLRDISSQHHVHGSSTSLSSAAHDPQQSPEYVKAVRHLTESMKRTEESRSQVIKMLRQSASAATTTLSATVTPEVPEVVAPIAVTPPPLGMDIDGDSIMDDDEMEDDIMMWFIDDPITTEKFEPLPPLPKQFDQELPRQQQPHQPPASPSRPSRKEPSLKYTKLAQFLNGSRGALTDGLQESREQLGYEVVWIKNQRQREQRE